jgi:hypothetical protein
MKLKNKALRKRCTLFSFGAIVASTISLSGIAQPVRSNTDDSEMLLRRSLTDMGYISVDIKPCRISFAREFAPNEENNGFFKYVRSIDLRNLRLDELTYVKKKRAGRTSFYEISAPFNTKYENAYRAVP